MCSITLPYELIHIAAHAHALQHAEVALCWLELPAAPTLLQPTGLLKNAWECVLTLCLQSLVGIKPHTQKHQILKDISGVLVPVSVAVVIGFQNGDQQDMTKTSGNPLSRQLMH
jgi:hypothetical protein